MKVSSFHIQSVIKAYGQRLGKRSFVKLKLVGNDTPSPDTIDISPEAKRKQLLHEITNNIVNMAKEKREPVSVSNEIIEKIGAKLGDQVDIIPHKNKKTGFKFKILTKNNEEELRELSFEDLKKIVENFCEEDGELK